MSCLSICSRMLPDHEHSCFGYLMHKSPLSLQWFDYQLRNEALHNRCSPRSRTRVSQSIVWLGFLCTAQTRRRVGISRSVGVLYVHVHVPNRVDFSLSRNQSPTKYVIRYRWQMEMINQRCRMKVNFRSPKRLGFTFSAAISSSVQFAIVFLRFAFSII